MSILKFEKTNNINKIDPLIHNSKALNIVGQSKFNYSKQLLRAVAELHEHIAMCKSAEDFMLNVYDGEICLERYSKYLVRKGFFVLGNRDYNRDEVQLLYIVVFMTERAMLAKKSQSANFVIFN